MNMELTDVIRLQPVGAVRNSVDDKEHHGWKDVHSDIIIQEQYVPALEGLSDFSHIIVFFWLHQVTPEQRAMRRARPLRRADIPELGIFSWHSSRRPNPIGMTVVKLLGVHRNRVEVQGLDAVDGTPVLDLRPYVESYYHVDDPREPEWVEKTRREGY